MTIFPLTGTERLGDHGVEAHEKSCAEQSEDNEDIGAETDRTHCSGAVGEMADHDGVHDGHAHPAKLGEYQRQGEAHRGRQFFAESFQANHGTVVR